jgi:hypothetical protein
LIDILAGVRADTELEHLPSELREVAELTGSRELLWPPASAPEAVNWAQERGLAILAVELFGRDPVTRETVYGDWHTEPRWNGEPPWLAHVRYAAKQARESIRRAEMLHARVDHRRYFIAVSAEADYPREHEPAQHYRG